MFKVLSATTFFVTVSAHGRWKCPAPRDANDENGNHITFDNTGNKVTMRRERERERERERSE
jgi:hypothetical protein